MRRSVELDTPADVARPFIVVAAVCFAAGFYGYLAVSSFLAP
jgi:hypothetical protein